MSPQPATGGWLAPLRGPDGRIPTRTRWIIAGVIVLLVMVTSVAGIFWALVAILGLALTVLGIVALVNGSVPRTRLRSRRAGTIAVIVGLFAVIIGSSANAGVQPDTSSQASLISGASIVTDASASPAPKPKRSATPVPTPTAVATEGEVQETTVIPFAAVSVDDDTLDVGTSAVSISGGNGEKVTTYLVKYIDGVEVSRAVAREETTVQPVDEVTSVGTRVPEPVAAAEPAPESNGCDSNYADVCVPIASDVDCAGGSGNGPAYVDGPVRIVGVDVYDLDRDGDGIACDA